MKEFVGVLSSADAVMRFSPLKQAALIFDRLALPGATTNLLLADSLGELGLERAAEVQWLIQKSVIFETGLEDVMGPTLTESKMSKKDVDGFHHGLAELEKISAVRAEANESGKIGPLTEADFLLCKQLLDKLKKDPYDAQTEAEISEAVSRQPLFWCMLSGFVWFAKMSVHEVRCVSAGLRKIKNMDAYPVLQTNAFGNERNKLPKSDVIQISLNAFPFATDSIPWEEILEYRNTAEIEGKFVGFRHWMSEIARHKLSAAEVEEKLEYLLSKYQRHLDLHRLKTELGTIETVVVASAEILENLMKFNWSKIARGLFTLKHRRIALMEAELTAPGNEIAYIAGTREKFVNRS
ncbi:MAG TPA: hypothetical protein VFZ40_21245 [Pyrinomonadaceae bacterium]